MLEFIRAYSINNLSGTDGRRLRCRQFYTSSNYPHRPFPRSSKKCLQKLLSHLSLRRSDDLAHETFPTAFQRMNGNSSLRELRTMSPIAPLRKITTSHEKPSAVWYKRQNRLANWLWKLLIEVCNVSLHFC
jgi:hypothetical protein